MTDPKTPVAPTEFENVYVVAIPELDPISGKTVYKTTFVPDSLKVQTYDAVINYQLISPTPPGVQFTRMTVSPIHNEQLSIPSVSKSGKLITFSDANTVQETLSITLHFTDKDGLEFNVDPDLDNVPPI